MVTKLLMIVVLGIVVGVALGTIFSWAYPTIEIDFGLSLLFAIIGLLIVLVGDKLRREMKRDKK